MADEVFDPRQAFESARSEYTGFRFRSWDGETEHELPNPLLDTPDEVRAKLGLGPDDDIEELDPVQGLRSMAPDAWDALMEMPLLARRLTLSGWMTHIGADDVLNDDGEDEAGKAP